MLYTYIILRGKFSQDIFNQKINEAKEHLCQINNLSADNFILKRKSNEISYSVNLEFFTGKYLEFEITKDKNIIGSLSCFMSENFNYINIT
ncbi:hypothetical protein IQ05_00625 [Flavobacterium tiangeerense]|uniref:Uncharacterized protein n=1 Tax=Flavobacterium tiangeerense TaxID=459471 RepID=A0ABY3FMK7_9FLAO|nr:hypothetical protein IQ05_00625 [Flavobacterium tiangeerense]